LFTRGDLVDFLVLAGQVLSSIGAGIGIFILTHALSGMVYLDCAEPGPVGTAIFIGCTASFILFCVIDYRRDRSSTTLSLSIGIYVAAVVVLLIFALLDVFFPGLMEWLAYLTP
jgi:riboflavin transporter FmnP